MALTKNVKEVDMNTKPLNRFAKGSGCYKCRICGKLTRKTGDGAEVLLCESCYDLAGWENAHSDENHKKYPNEHCPFCNGRVPAGWH